MTGWTRTAVALLGVLLACSSSSSSSSDGSARALHPPSNIDTTRCANVTMTTSAAPCQDCCVGAGFAAATTIPTGGANQCICGNPLGDPDAGAGVCMNGAATPTGSDCQDCCKAAGYEGYSSSTNATNSMTTCRCISKGDKKVCAGESTDGNCDVCCINAGYLTYGPSSIGSKDCICYSP